MARPPEKSDEELAADAMRDIYANVTDARSTWKDYDLLYVTQRILRAIREAKGA